jgi:hypothetical protein
LRSSFIYGVSSMPGGMRFADAAQTARYGALFVKHVPLPIGWKSQHPMHHGYTSLLLVRSCFNCNHHNANASYSQLHREERSSAGGIIRELKTPLPGSTGHGAL